MTLELHHPAGTIEAHQPDRAELLLLAWLAGYTSEHTRRAYRRDVTTWLTWCKTHQLDPLDVRRFHVDAWIQSGAGFTAEPADRTLARRLSAVSAYYAYAVEEEVADRNPCLHVRRPKVDRDNTPTRGLTRDEAKVMLHFARDAMSRRDSACVHLMLVLGLRRSAVANADADQLGWDRGHRTLTYRRKGGGDKAVPMPPAVAHSVDTYLAGRATGPLIQTRNGKRVQGSTVFRAVQRCARIAGVVDPESITPHSLRHAFATLALDAGVSLRDVQDGMDHADPRTTRIYDRARDSLDRHPAYQLGSLLGE